MILGREVRWFCKGFLRLLCGDKCAAGDQLEVAAVVQDTVDAEEDGFNGHDSQGQIPDTYRRKGQEDLLMHLIQSVREVEEPRVIKGSGPSCPDLG